LNGWVGVIGMDFYPTRPHHQFRNGTRFRVLYRGAKEVELPKPSPDGRFLAFGEVVSASNIWPIEGLSQ
jgi:hypothetical protein